jgi:ElaA protein
MGPTPTPEVHRATFDELPAHVLYGMLRLRSEVFVVEQACVFLDLDDRDHEPDAEHLWTADDAGVSGTVRLLHEDGPGWSIGRVVVRADVRSQGIAGRLVRAALERLAELGAATVHIGAQAHLRDWYARFGFAPSGPRYVEDGIPHLPMSLELGTPS